MNEPVGLQQDDDVTVLNRPAAQALYQPRHSTAQDTMDDEIQDRVVSHCPAEMTKMFILFIENETKMF